MQCKCVNPKMVAIQAEPITIVNDYPFTVNLTLNDSNYTRNYTRTAGGKVMLPKGIGRINYSNVSNEAGTIPDGYFYLDPDISEFNLSDLISIPIKIINDYPATVTLEFKYDNEVETYNQFHPETFIKTDPKTKGIPYRFSFTFGSGPIYEGYIEPRTYKAVNNLSELVNI